MDNSWIALTLIGVGSFIEYADVKNHNPLALLSTLISDPGNFRASLTSNGSWAPIGSIETTAKSLGDSAVKNATGETGALVSPVAGTVKGGGYAFGPRNGRLHAGQDIPVPVGTPIVAAMAGTVVAPYTAASAGKNVKISHGAGLATRYLHLSRIDVKVGEKVTAGQVIGLSGNTGRSTGPHLHFQIDNPLPTDPVKWFTAHGKALGSNG